MRDGPAVDPNLSLAEMLPPDKADQSGILQAGFALVSALARRAPSAGQLEVTVTLGPAAWAALETETRRPYRGHAIYKYTPHPGGAGAVRWVRDGTITGIDVATGRTVVDGVRDGDESGGLTWTHLTQMAEAQPSVELVVPVTSRCFSKLAADLAPHPSADEMEAGEFARDVQGWRIRLVRSRA